MNIQYLVGKDDGINVYTLALATILLRKMYSQVIEEEGI